MCCGSDLVEGLSRVGAGAEVESLEHHGVLCQGPRLVTQQVGDPP